MSSPPLPSSRRRPSRACPDHLRPAGSRHRVASRQPGSHPEHSLLEVRLRPRRDAVVRGHSVRPHIRVSPQGEFTVAANMTASRTGSPSTATAGIFIADYANGIMVLDPESGKVSAFVTRVRLERLKAVNDLVFGQQRGPLLHRPGADRPARPDGSGLSGAGRRAGRLLLDNVPSPNGIALDPAETSLYVAVTRANAVWRVPLMPDGGVAKVGNFIQLSGGGGPDGLAVDREGNIAVAHIGLGCVWLFSKRGEPMARIQSCAGHHTTNMAFGGPTAPRCSSPNRKRDPAARRNARARTPALFPPGALAARAMPRPGRF